MLPTTPSVGRAPFHSLRNALHRRFHSDVYIQQSELSLVSVSAVFRSVLRDSSGCGLVKTVALLPDRVQDAIACAEETCCMSGATKEILYTTVTAGARVRSASRHCVSLAVFAHKEKEAVWDTEATSRARERMASVGGNCFMFCGPPQNQLGVDPFSTCCLPARISD